MALSSSRQDSTVDPDKGIYVEMEGIMEIRWMSEDLDFDREPEDFFYFQRRVKEIPEDFCHKDKITTEQALFFCLVCNCDLKSLRPLRDHVKGNKHIRKACEKKRQIMGLPAEPPNAPRIKKLKKEKPKVNLGMSLQKKLEDCGEPAIGLGFVREYWNPNNSKDIPMYTCELDGCKSAWGTSDDMFNHVKKPKHHKNFFRKLNPDDNRIDGLSNAEILCKAAEYEEEHVGSDERDYEVILQVRDYHKYMELRDRPDDWSQKKANLGIDSSNPNTMPLGKRKSSDWGRKEEETSRGSPPLFNEDDWKDWVCPTEDDAMNDFRKKVRNGVKDIFDMVDDFQGRKGDEKYEEVKFHIDMIGMMLLAFEDDNDKELILYEGQLESAKSQLQDKTENEDREMKSISKDMAELEEEIVRYHADRDSNKYKNIRERMTEITKKLKDLKPTRDSTKKLKEDYNSRLAELWTVFESRSDSLFELLERQIGRSSNGGSSQKRQEERKTAELAFKKDITSYIIGYLESEIGNKFEDVRELETFVGKVVEDKIMKTEVNAHIKKEAPWSAFKVDSSTRRQVENYLAQKMPGYVKGSVYKS